MGTITTILALLFALPVLAYDPGTAAAAWYGAFTAATNAGWSTAAPVWATHSHPAGFPTNAAPVLVWNTNSFLYGKAGYTSISQCNTHGGPGSYNGQVPIRLLTRRHGVTAGHQSLPTGTNTIHAGVKVFFCDTNGTVQTAVIGHQITRWITNGIDYAVFVFQEDVPATVEVGQVATAAQLAAAWPSPLYAYDLGSTCQHGYARPAGYNSFPQDSEWLDHSIGVPGDSGSATFLPFPGLLVFGLPCVDSDLPQLQEDLRTLCILANVAPGDYTLSFADLSPFATGIRYAGKPGKGVFNLR